MSKEKSKLPVSVPPVRGKSKEECPVIVLVTVKSVVAISVAQSFVNLAPVVPIVCPTVWSVLIKVPVVGRVTLVAPVEVKVVLKFPLNTNAAEALFGIVKVPAVGVIINPLIEVAVAAPRTGATNVLLLKV